MWVYVLVSFCSVDAGQVRSASVIVSRHPESSAFAGVRIAADSAFGVWMMMMMMMNGDDDGDDDEW